MVKFALALKYWGQFSLGSIYVIKFIKSKNIFTCYFFHFKMTNKPLKEKESVKRPYLSFHFLKCGKRLIYTCKQKQLTCIGFFIFQTSFLGYKYCFFFFFYLRGVSGSAYAHHDYSSQPTGHPASPGAGKAPRGWQACT